MKKIITSFLVLGFAISTIGCASNISPKTYSLASVGQVNMTFPGTIVSAREVGIAGSTALGSNAGGLAGAVVGSAAGSQNIRGNLVGAIGGAIVGGLAGAAIEANATKQIGIEYIVETEKGKLLTIVQGSDPTFTEGQKVLILFGAPSRVIADPRKNQSTGS